MTPALQIDVSYDRIRDNAAALRARLAPANVEFYAVLKANAYGCGIRPVAETLAPLVDAFYLFEIAEAIASNLSDFNKRILALDHPWQDFGESDYLAAKVTPVVYSAERAAFLRGCRPVLAIDTGMQRFGCPPHDVEKALKAGEITEAMTHASRPEQVAALKSLTSGHHLKIHAAASHLLEDPTHWLNAVRPGLALYRGAVTAHTRLIECRDTRGPAGYTRFTAPRIGVIPVGYTSSIKVGPCFVADHPARIREVGMQTAYVEVPPTAKLGDRVTLLGEGVTEADLAAAWGVSPQEVLVRLQLSRNLGVVP